MLLISLVVCDPPCENGACVATNTCLCAQGYIGNTCSTPGTCINISPPHDITLQKYTLGFTLFNLFSDNRV